MNHTSHDNDDGVSLYTRNAARITPRETEYLVGSVSLYMGIATTVTPSRNDSKNETINFAPAVTSGGLLQELLLGTIQIILLLGRMSIMMAFCYVRKLLQELLLGRMSIQTAFPLNMVSSFNTHSHPVWKTEFPGQPTAFLWDYQKYS